MCLLDLKDLQERASAAWAAYAAGRISLLAATATTNLCVRHAERVAATLELELPDFAGAASIERCVPRRTARTTERSEKQDALRRAVGRRQARGPAILTHSTSASRSSFALLQRNRSDRLAAHVPIGTRVKGLATPVNGQHVCETHPQRGEGKKLEADALCECCL